VSNGKGSNPRPLSVSREEFVRRWEKTFPRAPDVMVVPYPSNRIHIGSWSDKDDMPMIIIEE
jgi:hypothetical protein